MKKLLLLSFAFLLAGCVNHLTQQECQTMNWYNEGVIDGAAGKNPRDLSQSEQDCLKFKINNAGVYTRGWEAGIKQYCTPTRDEGVIDGRNGAPKNKIKAIRGDFCTAAGSPLKFNTYLGGYTHGMQSR
ncbi:MAG: hypothetical protein A3C55_03760 [Gammaproteobacteria bacterium RIFCSPHIGHO2_02_FULL_42_13]|nr:MAG: hypothetical protein A3C55_03760 [Gammaproteobacteria bacterium RIFCSPHIGHO2_02_FULL_42_13]OGT70227.1 MAG: hypothetical protein A3H43_05990 [Gammaproteobacteria bacterium RIFCSPLOWO2_02_FULL_42_9]